MLTTDEYIEQKGLACPNCEGNSVQLDGTSDHCNTHYKICSCADCGAAWTEKYELKGYEKLTLAKSLETEIDRQAPS